MGVSTDAMLAYGYVWEDEFDLLGNDGDSGEDEENWVEIIAARRGISDPWAAYPQEIERLPYDESRRKGREWTEAHQAELDAWDAAKKAITGEYGVEIDEHGSGEWSVPVVKITGAGHTAARGHPHKLTADDLAVDPAWDARLQRFVTDLGIDTSEAKGPGWFLMSWWG
jgi:hypothetical protein